VRQLLCVGGLDVHVLSRRRREGDPLMAARKCPGCGSQMRRGYRAQLIGQDGRVRTAIVCITCDGRGVRVVAERVPPVVASNEKFERSVMLSPFIKKAEGNAKLWGKYAADVATTRFRLDQSTEDIAEIKRGYELRQEIWEAVAHMLKEGRV
jgi:hypothetical protein